MTYDVSRDMFPREWQELFGKKYDYSALGRIKHFCDEPGRRMSSKYVDELSMNQVIFQTAENTYDEELKRLKRTINGQFAIRKQRNSRSKTELSLKARSSTIRLTIQRILRI
jgi:hypothetical protein